MERTTDVGGTRTPYDGGAGWPVRVDSHLRPGLTEFDVDRWAQSACVLRGNGCGCDIAVVNGRARERTVNGGAHHDYIATHAAGFDRFVVRAAPVEITWAAVGRAAHALRDRELSDLTGTCVADTRVALDWPRTRTGQSAPQALIAAS